MFASRQTGRHQKAQASVDCNELLVELTASSLRSIGMYAILEPLGSGTYGDVRLGVHKLTNEKVAIKIVDKRHTMDVVREVELWRKLRHPRIAQLFEVLVSESKIYLVMELAARGEMLHWLGKSGRASEATARRWFRQIAGAVAYLHERGLVHRDLKLENILLDDELNVKIVDFGFAQEFDSRRMLDTFCGSMAYASPEIIAGKKYKGPEVDVWSLGVVLFTILCGHLPFEDDDPAVVQERITTSIYQIPEHLSAEARELLTRIFKVKTKDRLDIGQILAHAWLHVGDGDDSLLSSSCSPSSRHQLSPPTSGSTMTTFDGHLAPPSYLAPSFSCPANREISPTRSAPLRHYASVSSTGGSPSRAATPDDTTDLVVLLHRAGIDTDSMMRSVRRGRADSASAFFYMVQATVLRRAHQSQHTLVASKSSDDVLDGVDAGLRKVEKQLMQADPPPAAVGVGGLRALFGGTTGTISRKKSPGPLPAAATVVVPEPVLNSATVRARLSKLTTKSIERLRNSYDGAYSVSSIETKASIAKSPESETTLSPPASSKDRFSFFRPSRWARSAISSKATALEAARSAPVLPLDRSKSVEPKSDVKAGDTKRKGHSRRGSMSSVIGPVSGAPSLRTSNDSVTQATLIRPSSSHRKTNSSTLPHISSAGDTDDGGRHSRRSSQDSQRRQVSRTGSSGSIQSGSSGRGGNASMGKSHKRRGSDSIMDAKKRQNAAGAAPIPDIKTTRATPSKSMQPKVTGAGVARSRSVATRPAVKKATFDDRNEHRVRSLNRAPIGTSAAPPPPSPTAKSMSIMNDGDFIDTPFAQRYTSMRQDAGPNKLASVFLGESVSRDILPRSRSPSRSRMARMVEEEEE